MYALRNIPWKSENKIRPSLRLPHFHEQGWEKKKNKNKKKKTANKETNKTQYNSL